MPAVRLARVCVPCGVCLCAQARSHPSIHCRHPTDIDNTLTQTHALEEEGGGWVGGWGGLVQQLVPRPSFGFPLGESEKVPVYCQLHPPYSTHPPTQPLLFLSPEQVPCRSAELIWWLSWRRWMASVWCTEVVTPWKSVNTL